MKIQWKPCLVLSLLLIFFWFSGSAQDHMVKTISADNKLEIHNVQIKDSLGQLIGTTDFNGNITISKAGTYSFEKPGYSATSARIEGTILIVVELKELPLELGEVLIKSDHFQNELKQIASSIGIITETQLKSNDGVNIAPILNTVPGVYMHNGTLNTNRITIRGIGSRNLFGTSKIRAYYQDIPLTNGSGETSIEDIELEGIARMEVLKGPSSSLYGAGLGGTIQLIPDTGIFDSKSIQSAFTIGSFGLRKFWINTNLANKTNAAKITYSNTESEGYRENNELHRQTLTVASNHYLNEKNNLTVLGNFIDLKAYIPSSLDEDDYLNDPSKAAFTWGRSEGFEDYSKFLLGLSWQHEYNEKSKQVTSIFSSFFDSYEARPFNIQEQNTQALGIRSRFIQNTTIGEKTFQWTAGLELFNDHNLIKTFENLYQDYPPGSGSVEGELLGEFKENRYYINLFSEAKYHVANHFTIDFGLNLNHTAYDLEDRYNQGSDDFSGKYSFDPILSPKLGLIYQASETMMFFATISHGFSPPKLEETLLPDGLINNEIQPETGWNYEIGSRGKIIKDLFNYDVSLYYMDVENLLVARRTGDDQFIGVNAGNTVHMGVEIMLNYFLINKKNLQLSHSNSFSLNRYTFEDFTDLDEDYSGNDLTGVPDKTFYSQLNLNTSLGLYALINYNYVGEIPITDDNSVYAHSYQVVNFKTGFGKMIGQHFKFDLQVGINNLFDEKYASMLQINAVGFGNNAPRYYYPGNPVNYYSSLNLNYSF